MQNKQQFCNSLFRIISRAATAALAMATVFALTVPLTQSAQAQTFTVLHNFTGGGDGAGPSAGLTMDQAGNIYGTATQGGSSGAGTVFRLSKKSSNWVLNPLYSFAGGNDGPPPEARVVFGPDGTLYGTTRGSLNGYPYGTVFNLNPYPTACKTAICGWQETVLYSFSGGSDGADPGLGDLIFDQAGNLYGTTEGGGYGGGVVFELVPSQGGWTERVLYSFTGGNDGAEPLAGLVFDNVGNLYSTTATGGTLGNGVVYELTPSGSGWTEKVLYSFQGGDDGGFPFGGLLFDQSGNLYGTTWSGGQGGGGTVFKLTPSNGSWTFSLVYSFTGAFGSAVSLVMEGPGNLYGTTYGDGAYGWGSAFKLAPSNGGWTYTSLHDFTGVNDGGNPIGGLVFDASGNLYGTTSGGGPDGAGLVFEITP